MIEWHSPYSSIVSRIGHDPETNEVHVEWTKSGRISIYSGVDAGEFETGRKSRSVGRWLHTLILAGHPHRYAE